METPYASPLDENAKDQPGLHTKHYIAMEQDIHYQKGMKCQDCHTSIDVHGDGFLAATNLAAVQIECSDCHGTPDQFPWELPLGFMDEFAVDVASGSPRGTTPHQLPHTWAGAKYDSQDGFLLTARGNPYENVVRVGDEVVVHTAEGKDIRLKPLKKLVEEKAISQRGLVSMQGVSKHLNRMECYTCHASWAPQCFGCHVKVDFSQKDLCPEIDSSRQGFDWIAAGRKHATDEHLADSGESDYDLMIPGKISELRSYLRWEEPMMGVNGEGRVTPLAPGCQPSVTIIGADGKPILTNHIFKTPGGMEGSGDEGQLAIDMSPVQPHTMTKNARTCESCHASDKALGLGINGPRNWDEKHVVDLETTDGTILPESARTQMGAIENLDHDWSQIVDKDGNQLATVGHHWKLSRSLNKDEITRISRDGTCVACHKEIPEKDLAVSLMHHVGKYTGGIPVSAEDHGKLVNKILLTSAWGQALLATGVLAVVLGGGYWASTRRKKLSD